MDRSLVRLAGRALAYAAMPGMILLVLSPLLLHPWTLGQHDWDQMNTQRQVVVTTILRYHQFPLWDPFTCGGHPAWGSLESDPIVVSPFLPVYLVAPLALAIRAEIVGWVVVGALGAWRLASRFAESVALRSLFVVATVVNSRMTMQVAAGHAWHLLYALLPWALFFFDRALAPDADPRRARRDVVMAGACLALMGLGDGIYPLPHTAMGLAIYAAVIARATRSWAPVRALGWTAAAGVGLASPKLVPLLESLLRFPRYIKSDEIIWPQYLLSPLTWREGDYTASGAFVVGMWHEWGLYLGWPALVGLVAAVVASRGARERGLKWAGLVMCSFVLGGIHPLLPWGLLHMLPVFRSQHVPSRWLYPAIVLLASAALSGADKWLRGRGASRPSWEAALGVAAALLAVQMGTVARESLAASFVEPAPVARDDAGAGAFHLVHRLPPRPDYHAGVTNIASLPAVLDGEGTLECVTDHRLHSLHRDAEGRMAGLGAFAVEDPDYRGEAYVAERGGATAVVSSWSPNVVEVRVDGADPGDHVVLNQNYDPGWRADGQPAVPYRDAVAAVATARSQTVRFAYAPRSAWIGLGAFVVTLVIIGVALKRAGTGRQGHAA